MLEGQVTSAVVLPPTARTVLLDPLLLTLETEGVPPMVVAWRPLPEVSSQDFRLASLPW